MDDTTAKPARSPRCIPLLYFLYIIYLLYFHILTDTPTPRPLINPFAINPLRTLFISTEGVPLPLALPSRPRSLLTTHYPPQVLSFHTLAHSFAHFCIFLHSPKTQLSCFQSITHSFTKTPGVGYP